MLVRDIIENSFHELKVYQPGDDIAQVDAARGFRSLNTMLESWSTENLSCFCTLEQSIALVAGIPKYSIGPGGTIDTSQGNQRPIRLIEGPGAAYVQDGNGNNYSVDVIGRDEWNLIGNRVVTNSNYPDTIWYDPQFPTSYINVFPVPNANFTLYFDSYSQIMAFKSLDLDITLPPGYAKALQHNLSLDLEPIYPTAKLSQRTVIAASEAKANVKRSNKRTILAKYDPELSRASNRYNIYTDGWNRSGR